MSQIKRGAKPLPKHSDTAKLFIRFKLCGLKMLVVSRQLGISYGSLRYKLMGHVGWTPEEWSAINKLVNRAEKDHLKQFDK